MVFVFRGNNKEVTGFLSIPHILEVLNRFKACRMLL